MAEKLQDAERQLATCREKLERTANAPLKLHTHAMVGIGLERLMW